MHRSRSISAGALAALVAVACMVRPALACDVPVFRYALERWEADAYHAVVFRRGPLDAGASAACDVLRAATREGGGHANLEVHVVDLDGEPSEAMRSLWQRQTAAATPWIVLLYPVSKAGDRFAWSGPLTAETARAVVASPGRTEIARRLTDGQTAVWVLVETGDRRTDDAAAALVERELARMPQRLTLPPEIGDAAPHVASRLRIEFSLLRISRTDPAETALAAMLLRSEADLLTAYAGRPVVFPVFGRGRVLFAAVGDGIAPASVLMGCSVLVGRCSCEVKDDNPGTDLLVDYPWQEALDVSLVDLVELPSPIGPGPAPPDASEAPAPAGTGAVTASGGALMRNTLVALGFVLVAAALLALGLAKRTRRD